MVEEAVSIGEAVPRPGFEGAVQACFDNAVNLRLRGRDRIVTLLVSDHYELPQGIRIASRPPMFGQIRVGTPAWAQDDVLRFEDASLVIDLSRAETWTCPVRSLEADMGGSRPAAAWSAAWGFLNQRQREEGSDIVGVELLGAPPSSALGRRLAEGARGLLESARGFDVDGATRAARTLIGLGRGLTPAGDDLLVGFLAGLWGAVGKNRRRQQFLGRFGDGLLALRPLTTDLSATYVLHATDGLFSSSLSNLLAAIAHGDPVSAPAEEAFRVGHSSGTDAATGLLLGLAAWQPQLLTGLLSSRAEAGWERT